MNSFEYAAPESESEAVALLAEPRGQTAVLAGGTDFFNLLQRDLISPRRVVDIKRIPALQQITSVPDGLMIGAAVTLDEIQRDPRLAGYAAVQQVISAINSIQVQAMGTLVGDLCLQPNCWYYRSGYGLLGRQNGESLVAAGRNELHAILGNGGPAKYVSASRFAPALIALGAKVRIVGPAPDQVTLLPLDAFFVTPKDSHQGTTVLQPGQLVTHVWLPMMEGWQTASYEVLQMNGLDWPLATASVAMQRTSGGMVQSARIVLGHVAPVPWVATAAAASLSEQMLTAESAEKAADLAVARATPLSENEFKVQIARAAVKRALLRAAGQLEGDLA